MGFYADMLGTTRPAFGVGTKPQNWGGGYKAIEVGAPGAALFGGADTTCVTAGVYYNGQWTHANAAFPSTVYQQGGGNHYWFSDAAGPSGSAYLPTERMRLAGGKLGVGRVATTQTLEVAGAIWSTNGVLFDAGGYAGSLGPQAFNIGCIGLGSLGAYPLVLGTNSVERVRVDAFGNVGIGISPAMAFHVNRPGTMGTGSLYLLGSFSESGSGGSKGVGLGYDNTSQTGIVWPTTAGAASNMAFWTFNTAGGWSERVRFDSVGNVGVNVIPVGVNGINPMLHLRGSFGTSGLTLTSSWDGNSSVGLYGGINSADNPAIVYQANLRFGTVKDLGVGGFVERMRLDSGGNLIVALNPSAPAPPYVAVVMTLASNNSLRFSVRGTDGATRSGSVALS